MFRILENRTLIGWSRGAYYSFFNHAESRLLQNRSHFAAAFYQYYQLSQVVALAFESAPRILPERFNRPLRIAVRALSYVSIPLLAMVAKINSGGYREFAIALNRWLPIPLPTTVHPVTRKSCAFIARQGSNILKAAMLATLFIHYRLGARAYALSFTAAILFRALESYHFIPDKINLVINRIMTVMTFMTVLYQGPMANRIICLIQLPIFFPSVMSDACSRLDQWMRGRWPIKFRGFSLKALESPWQDHKEMTLNQIEEFLNRAILFHRAALDPSHLTKSVMSDVSCLKKSEDYNQLIEMWNQHNWTSRVPFLLDRLLQDDKFIDQFIEDIFCNREHVEAERKRELIENLHGHFQWINHGESHSQEKREVYLMQWLQSRMPGAQSYPVSSSSLQQRMAQPSLQPVEEYVIQKIREMLTRFVESLNNPSSESHSLRENVSVLIPFFEQYKACLEHDSSNDLARKGFEVGLLKLVLSKTALQDSEKILQLCLDDPLLANGPNTSEQYYEYRLKVALYNMRLALIEQLLSQQIELLGGQHALTGKLFESSMRPHISRGFIPQHDSSIESIGFTTLINWEMAEELRLELYDGYYQHLQNLDILQGEDYQNYVKSMIRGKEQQRQGQIEALIQRFENVVNDPSSCLNRKFKYLILYRLGIIRLIDQT